MKKDFDRDTTWSKPHEKYNTAKNNIREMCAVFHNLEKRINPNNSIYNYKTEWMSSKDFSDYQNPIDFLKI